MSLRRLGIRIAGWTLKAWFAGWTLLAWFGPLVSTRLRLDSSGVHSHAAANDVAHRLSISLRNHGSLRYVALKCIGVLKPSESLKSLSERSAFVVAISTSSTFHKFGPIQSSPRFAHFRHEFGAVPYLGFAVERDAVDGVPVEGAVQTQPFHQRSRTHVFCRLEVMPDRILPRQLDPLRTHAAFHLVHVAQMNTGEWPLRSAVTNGWGSSGVAALFCKIYDLVKVAGRSNRCSIQGVKTPGPYTGEGSQGAMSPPI